MSADADCKPEVKKSIVQIKQEFVEGRFAVALKRPHQCVVCYRAFRTVRYLNEHLSIHRDEKPFRCGVCQKGFRFSTGLKAHRSIHVENNLIYSCPAAGCFQASRTRSNLKSHMKRIHYKSEVELNAMWKTVCERYYRKPGPSANTQKKPHQVKREPVVVKREVKSETQPLPASQLIDVDSDSEEEVFVGSAPARRAQEEVSQISQMVSPRLSQLLTGNQSSSDPAASVLHLGDMVSPYYCEFCSVTLEEENLVVAHVWQHVSVIKQMFCYECTVVNCDFKTNVRNDALAHKSRGHPPEDGCKIVDQRKNLDDFFKNCLRKYFKNLDQVAADMLFDSRHM